MTGTEIARGSGNVFADLGLPGAVIPLALKRLGADRATASSIFLTTASDVASMGVFPTLATVLLI